MLFRSLPWPGAIGYRRFHQGVLIRAGKTRLVAYGTVIRVVVMGGTAMLAYLFLPIPGAWVGAVGLSAGVVTESASIRIMANATVRDLLTRADAEPVPADVISYPEIVSFYYPLALTSLIGLAVQPMATFFLGRSAYPVESLAVFPVVQALSFAFRAPGMAYQDATIALMGNRHEHLPELNRFTLTLGLTCPRPCRWWRSRRWCTCGFGTSPASRLSWPPWPSCRPASSLHSRHSPSCCPCSEGCW